MGAGPAPCPPHYGEQEASGWPHRHWAAERPARAAATRTTRSRPGAIGALTDREPLIAGAIAYWCEGGKSKPHRPSDRVMFINSDPALIRFFLRFLDAAGTPRTRLRFRVYIHENADVAAAQQFWLDVTGAAADQFATPTLKHHNPVTARKNSAKVPRLPAR